MVHTLHSGWIWFPDRKLFSKKLFFLQCFSLWLLSEIIIEVSVGIVVLVNVKHCALKYGKFIHVMNSILAGTVFSTCVYYEAATSGKEMYTQISITWTTFIVRWGNYSRIIQRVWHAPTRAEWSPTSNCTSHHHTWIFHVCCTGISSREGWWRCFMPFCKQSISDSDPLN